MSTKLSTPTRKKTSTKKTVKESKPKKDLTWKIVRTKEDKMLEKVEKYVDKSREETTKEIAKFTIKSLKK